MVRRHILRSLLQASAAECEFHLKYMRATREIHTCSAVSRGRSFEHTMQMRHWSKSFESSSAMLTALGCSQCGCKERVNKDAPHAPRADAESRATRGAWCSNYKETKHPVQTNVWQFAPLRNALLIIPIDVWRVAYWLDSPLKLSRNFYFCRLSTTGAPLYL